MNIKSLFLGAAVLAALSAVAYAAPSGLWSTLPTVSNLFGLTGNELIPADTQLASGANPQTEYVSVPQLRAVQYSQQTPLTGFSITIPQNVSILQLTPAGTLATGTITLPPSPVDGQVACIFDTQTQTAVTIAANAVPAGQTINGTALTALTANTRYCYLFAGTTTNAGTALAWFRVQ